MTNFFITIKKDNIVFGKYDKYEIDLDTSKDIVNQAEIITSSIFGTFEIPEKSRQDFAWKIFRNQGTGFGMVTKSKNWVED